MDPAEMPGWYRVAWCGVQKVHLNSKRSLQGIDLRFLVHDRDPKFPATFDEIVRAAGGRVVLTPLMAPRANAHAERWIGSCRRECLDRMLIPSRRHLEVVLRDINREERLGGILATYRVAA
jgi:hypothetical protein